MPPCGAEGSPERGQGSPPTQPPSHAPLRSGRQSGTMPSGNHHPTTLACPRAELKAVRNEDKAHPPPNHPRMPPCGADGSPERCQVATTTQLPSH
eukprot:CAMPEP_0181205820 /NCGR_PEP_ID=MMETSP1096-20121128/20686_1 /TAXON_ID=156174 ORGANISM="Chrysochromulina ericina, Strain CCMP281" /NCGR_SAMPLE_ID=MMETSP1096 /ASSEMBLY_ACC=CAM_ASM_000453 /LENGTH=94 /DNA_ID=CAMNT_0023296639 /DNA_START=359 /DNA_END=640 /DNA_ORIENTATION=+